MTLIEAVPNVSEGRNFSVLGALENLLCAAPGVHFLGADSNPVANRTVFTLIGQPQAVSDALFHFIALAAQRIDMRTHHGAHPRLGATDVCPLIALQDISLPQTAQLARKLGKRVGEELHIPVYLYEAAAPSADRKNLAFIRRGEYENLQEKLITLPPDFGPSAFTPSVQKTGATVIGARDFLIAFNINLNTADAQAAGHIAARIRETGGGLRGVKAIGWYMENFKRAQVSCNITDFQATPPHLVFERCRQEAAELGLQATGCELVGLIPLQAILESGKYYAPQETDNRRLIQAAVRHLNLQEVKPFAPEEQILEFRAGWLHL